MDKIERRSSGPGLARMVCCLSASVALTSCNSYDRLPAGMGEACYGGRDQYWAAHLCADPRAVVRIQGTRDDWPAFRALMAQFASEANLALFDDRHDRPGLDMLAVNVCRSDGVRFRTDERVWDDPRFGNDEADGLISVVLEVYDARSEWRPLVDRLVSLARGRWTKEVEVEWLPPRTDRRPLPDGFECPDGDSTGASNSPGADVSR